MRCNIAMAMIFGLVPIASAASNDTDAALMASCPGLSTWAEKHPRGGHELKDRQDELPASSPTALGSELTRRAELDQRARAFITGGQPPTPEQLSNLATVDADNLRWLKELVTRQGFPTAREVGRQGVSDAWLLIQHADSDPGFQRSVLDVLIADTTSHNLIKPEIAMLSDRVRLSQGKAQRYGTQFVRNKDGVLVLQQPVEDLPGIDALRAAMDLMPLDLYQCVLRTTYDPPGQKE